MEKYGFVYIWMDRKYPRFYIGSHWGSETDGYVCSSNWMYNTHKRRPQDFKRRILARGITSKQDLLIEEGKWLALIPKEEIGKRYYNLLNAQPGHWSAMDSSLSVKERLSVSQKKRFEDPAAREVASEKTLRYFEEHPAARDRVGEKSREFYSDPKNREATGRGRREYFSDPVNREADSLSLLKHYEDHPEAKDRIGEQFRAYYSKPDNKNNLRDRVTKQWADGVFRDRISSIQSAAGKKRVARERGEIPDDRTPAQIRELARQRERRAAKKLGDA
jgi:hypothetical protein